MLLYFVIKILILSKGCSMIKLHTNLGPITLVLYPEKTPKTVENFLEYVNQGFFENTIFHRVIDGFMIQGGGFEADPVDTQEIKQKDKAGDLKPIENEADKGLSNLRGTLAMARTNEPHSASNQFFINLKDNLFLNHESKTPQGWGYCAFGKVTEGMDIVDKIAKVATTRKSGHSDVPVEAVFIEKVEVMEQIDSQS